MVFLGVPIVFLWFAKDPEAHGDWRKPYGDWRKDPEGQRDWRKPYGDWRKPDGYARERGTMESAAVGRGQVDPGPVLGPVSWCAGVRVCRCASVPVCRWSRWCTNIPVCNTSVDFAMISLQLSYVFAIIILWSSSAPPKFVFGFLQVFQLVFLWVSYGFLKRNPVVCLWFPMCSFQFPRMSVWFSCEFPLDILWFPIVFIELFVSALLWFSMILRWFS